VEAGLHLFLQRFIALAIIINSRVLLIRTMEIEDKSW